MKTLIIGSGGREHALAWKTAQSQKVEKVFVAPGNAGTALESNVTNVAISPTDIPALVDFAKKEMIELTLVGPEAPLALGVVDAFNQAKLNCFGPTKSAAQLESSKAFSKAFMVENNIPTARYAHFTQLNDAKDYILSQGTPIVIKASGLAAGKGVVIAQDKNEAFETLENMLSGNAFGEAGHEVIIEEFLQGEEVSFMVISDGEHILPLATSQDHKARDNGDQGPNTGGMGAYSPAPVVTPTLEKRIIKEVIEPTIIGMEKAGNPYCGFLYAGIMITQDGDIKVLEFNCRLGDPETQPILLRLQSDLASLCQAALNRRLHQTKINWDERAALGVVLTAGGYPGSYRKGDVISGLDQRLPEHCKIFHSGTAQQNGNIVTNGGRVLCVTALGENVSAAQQQAYNIAKTIHWQDIYYRTDIGHRAAQIKYSR